MKVEQTHLDGVFIITPELKSDARGYFFESYNENDFKLATGLEIHWKQDNQAKSMKNVLRGLHFQHSPQAQAKLISVVQGEIWDVIVDLREESPTHMQWLGVALSEENHKQLFIPKGFAHGYAILSDTAIVQYKCDEFYNAALEDGLRYDDPFLNIDWKIDLDQAIISSKDMNWLWWKDR